MKLEWLEDLLAVAETASLTDAAERRNLTQSAFSRRVKAIEDHVGVPLFDRARKPLQLHPTTLQQQETIARLATDLRQLVNDLRRGSRASGNRVILASQHGLTTSLTPEILGWINSQAPDLHVRLRSAKQDECYGHLLSSHADFAFVYRSNAMPPLIEASYIETLILGSDRVIPVSGPSFADGLETEISAGELPTIAFPSSVFMGQLFEREVLPKLRDWVEPSPKVETGLTLAALELAAVGIGVAWVPSSLARARSEAGELRDLSHRLPSATIDVAATRLAGDTGVAQDLIWRYLTTIAPTPTQ